MSREIILGVGGGIAAYKSCELLRLLKESGHAVTVVPTASALKFVGRATWEALSGRPVATDLWENVDQVPHVRLAQQADLIVIAPATADLMARAVHGLADDLLTNILLMARCPVVMAPAMHTEMWLHDATTSNVTRLRKRGVVVLEPATGRLTGADSGPGRLPEAEEIAAHVVALLERASANDLAGRRVVVTAGGTQEPLDPVRFIGNRSSGRQGYAIARAAATRGAEVTLISANSALTDPAGVKVIRVQTAAELKDVTLAQALGADVVVMAAAVADYRPDNYASFKIKKEGQTPTISLTKTDDVLRALVAVKPDQQVVVGFAAETGDEQTSALEYAARKLRDKGCDLLVFNDVSDGRIFGEDRTEATILQTDGTSSAVVGSKDTLAHALLDQITSRLTYPGV